MKRLSSSSIERWARYAVTGVTTEVLGVAAFLAALFGICLLVAARW